MVDATRSREERLVHDKDWLYMEEVGSPYDAKQHIISALLFALSIGNSDGSGGFCTFAAKYIW
jgi:hypothetical protein